MTMAPVTTVANDVFGPLIRANELHPDVARFHLSRESTRGKGVFVVERGSGLSNIVATALRLPRAGNAVQVSLGICRLADGEIWCRTFDGLPVTTTHSLRSGQLVEEVGSVALRLRVTTKSSNLMVGLVRVDLVVLGHHIPMPARLSFRIEASVAAGPDPDTLHVRVHIWSPILGRLVRYEGDLYLEGER